MSADAVVAPERLEVTNAAWYAAAQALITMRQQCSASLRKKPTLSLDVATLLRALGPHSDEVSRLRQEILFPLLEKTPDGELVPAGAPGTVKVRDDVPPAEREEVDRQMGELMNDRRPLPELRPLSAAALEAAGVELGPEEAEALLVVSALVP